MEHHNLQGTGYMVNQNWYNKVAPIQTKEKKPASPDVPSRFSLVLAVEYELPRGGTSITLRARLTERIWLTKFHHSWIFTSVSVGSSPRSYLFTSTTDRISPVRLRVVNKWCHGHAQYVIQPCRRIGVYKLTPKYGTKFIRYVTLHFQKSARRSFASSKKSRSHNRSCPIRYDFHGRAKANQYSVNNCVNISVDIASDSYPVTIYKSDEKREDWMIIEARGDLWEDNSVPSNLNLLPAHKHINSD